MTTRRQDLIAAVAQIQNHPAHDHHDILTFCGWRDVTEADIERHIEVNLRMVAEHSQAPKLYYNKRTGTFSRARSRH